jgi:hypothetical protein
MREVLNVARPVIEGDFFTPTCVVPVFERRGVSDGLAIVRSGFHDIPQPALATLLRSVEGSFVGSRGQARTSLVDVLMNTGESKYFAGNLEAEGLQAGQISDLMADNGMSAMVSAMLDRPESYRMQLGIIGSLVTLDQMQEDVVEKLNPHHSGLDISLEPSHDTWDLCGSTETRLIHAIADGGVMAVGEEDNPYLLLKFKGKLTALCVQNVATEEGKVFVQGNWYSPTGDTRGDLTHAFDAGLGNVTPQGSWALMRPVEEVGVKTAEDVIAIGKKVARRLSTALPRQDATYHGVTMSRSQYRAAMKVATREGY